MYLPATASQVPLLALLGGLLILMGGVVNLVRTRL
jgi:LPXTG-motif cell wall-anchored protein